LFFLQFRGRYFTMLSEGVNSPHATSSPYQRISHPQDAGFEVMVTGFLVQWPILLP